MRDISHEHLLDSKHSLQNIFVVKIMIKERCNHFTLESMASTLAKRLMRVVIQSVQPAIK